MSFADLGLVPKLLRAIEDAGYTIPTPIQREAIPAVLAGHNLLAGAQTGTGKTAGFALPVLQRLDEDHPEARPIRALVLVPTRELAAQVHESFRTYGRHVGLRSAVIFGGVGINPQIETLKRRVDIVIATPGRLLDHVGQRTIDLRRVEILVLDEADRMLDMGFIRDIKRVLKLLPTERQNLLFSATFSDPIRALAQELMDDPVEVQVTPRNKTADRIEQTVHLVDKGRKRELLSYIIGSGNWRQVLVFTRTKHGANKLAEQLEKDGLSAAAIHGNKSQGARTRALADFKDGAVRVLVATDIAARGLDIDGLPHVVNFELPHVPEDYVHRIGRTARAGETGSALSLVSPDERAQLKDIERLLKAELPRITTAGFELDPSIKPEPAAPQRNRRPDRPAARSGGQRQRQSQGQGQGQGQRHGRSSASGTSRSNSTNRGRSAGR